MSKRWTITSYRQMYWKPLPLLHNLYKENTEKCFFNKIWKIFGFTKSTIALLTKQVIIIIFGNSSPNFEASQERKAGWSTELHIWPHIILGQWPQSLSRYWSRFNVGCFILQATLLPVQYWGHKLFYTKCVSFGKYVKLSPLMLILHTIIRSHFLLYQRDIPYNINWRICPKSKYFFLTISSELEYSSIFIFFDKSECARRLDAG